MYKELIDLIITSYTQMSAQHIAILQDRLQPLKAKHLQSIISLLYLNLAVAFIRSASNHMQNPGRVIAALSHIQHLTYQALYSLENLASCRTAEVTTHLDMLKAIATTEPLESFKDILS